MDSADDAAQQLNSQRWDDFSRGACENEEKLAPLDIGELDSLPLLSRRQL
jgi:hypothetical protein